jgi:enoyl-[acyl-carrier-protein] reductase (NADH)
VQGFVDYSAQARGVSTEEVVAELTEPMALPEMATDEDVAEAVAFFLSPRAKAITGQMLLVNAGQVVR